MYQQKKPVCTITLIVMNVLIFLILSFGGMTEDPIYMMDRGAMYVPFLTDYREWYRLFTCLFLHFDFDHLMNNMLILGVIGWNVEPLMGKVKFIFLYLGCGLGGNLLSALGEALTSDYSISAGASGAIFGLTGALLCLILLHRGRVGNLSGTGMLFMILASLYLGFTGEGVDNLAHIGGLITGMLLTLLMCRKQNVESSADVWHGLE